VESVGIQQETGNLYRNGRSGGFSALQAPATNLFNQLQAPHRRSGLNSTRSKRKMLQ
jgi:hypothetical protein